MSIDIVKEHSINKNMETYFGNVNTLADGLLILEGVRLGILPKVKRRMSSLERQFIKPNSVFVWCENDCDIKRWTDGKNWTPSKTLGPFLVYQELDLSKKTPMINGFTKKTYSLTTRLNEKYHLICYNKPTGSPNPTTPSTDVLLKDLALDPNIYQRYLLYNELTTTESNYHTFHAEGIKPNIEQKHGRFNSPNYINDRISPNVVDSRHQPLPRIRPEPAPYSSVLSPPALSLLQPLPPALGAYSYAYSPSHLDYYQRRPYTANYNYHPYYYYGHYSK